MAPQRPLNFPYCGREELADVTESESCAGMSGRGMGPSEVDIWSIQLPEVVEVRSPSKKEPEPGSECTSETELIPDVDGERGWLSDGTAARLFTP